MSLIKDITKVSLANFISLFSVLITGFIVPSFLSIEQYAYLKTFALVLSFVGLLHFGFIDGIYIKYGGKYLSELDLKIFKAERVFFIFFQLIIAILVLIIGILIKEPIVIAVSAAILPYNLLSYYQFLYQAIGQFNIYSKIKLIIPFLILVFNILLIYVFNVSEYLFYITGEIIAYTVVVFYLELSHLNKAIKVNLVKNLAELSDNFKVGFLIMLGNLALILFSTLGRWVVKFWMDDADFAYFSFATSMMQIITIVISSIAMTFYPYLSRINQSKDISQLKIQLIIVGAFLSSGYFFLNFAVAEFIPKYVTSLKILGVLFASLPAYTVIYALYINLYKVYKNGKKYIYVILLNLFAACVLTFFALLIQKSIIAISIATTLTYYFWMYYSSKDFEGLLPTIKEIVFISAYLSIYIASMLFESSLVGALFFLTFYSLLTLIYKKEVTGLYLKLISVAGKK